MRKPIVWQSVNCGRLTATVTFVTCLSVLTASLVAQEGTAIFGQKPAADDSIVDYLKSNKRDSTFEARLKLFGERCSGEKKYKGSAEQNVKLLDSLLADDKEATASVEATKLRLEESATTNKPEKADRLIEKSQTMRRWIPAEGFGVHGTYVVKVRGSISRGQISDRNFDVAVDSASTQLGTLTFSGTVDLYFGDAKVPGQRFKLDEAWFSTIAAANSTTAWRYAAKGTVIQIPPQKKVVAKVTVHPVVNTTAGSVPLREGTVEVLLNDK